MRRNRPALLLVLLFASMGCTAAADEGGGQSAAAQSGPSTGAGDRRFATADYPTAVDDSSVVARVVVHEGFVRGVLVRENDGDTCTVTFAGRIEELDDGSEGAVVTATDGWGATSGRLRVEEPKKNGESAPTLVLQLEGRLRQGELTGCGSLGIAAIYMSGAKPLNLPGVVGWAPVSVDKSFFHEGPSTGQRTDFVKKGDVVGIKVQASGAVVVEGFVQSEYVDSAGKTVTGFLSYADLASPWATGE